MVPDSTDAEAQHVCEFAQHYFPPASELRRLLCAMVLEEGEEKQETKSPAKGHLRSLTLGGSGKGNVS
ncbi:MAG: hypothetical protein SGPRY_011759 [Prymnesium sp.]